jgi:predicted permease
MEPLREIARRLRTLTGRGALDAGLDEEMRFHVDQQTAKNIRAGMPPEQARRAALVRFGGIEAMKESTRDEFRPALLEDFWRDLRYGARVLRRAPGFAVVSILTLALGIGAATTVFTLVEGVLLRPLPYADPDRIVRLLQVDANGRRNNNVSEPNFEDWQSGAGSAFAAMAEVAPTGTVPVSGASEPITTSGATVSKAFFAVMGTKPAVGRGFLPDEQRVGGPRAVIVSHRFWMTRLGGAAVDGQRLRISDEIYQVVGVMPETFDYPANASFWIPRELSPPQQSRTAHNFQAVARLADHTSVEAAHARLSDVSKALKQQHGDNTWMSDAAVVPLQQQLTAAARPTLLTLFGAAVLLLVIACLNVSNLQLARAAMRRRELALRMAIGAGRGRILRQMLSEALLLSAVAAAAGAALSVIGVRALMALQPVNLPRLGGVAVNGTVLVFAIAMAVVTAAALGLATAMRTPQHQLRESLTEGQRTMAGGRGRERVRHGLVIAQIALTMVLLAGAGLLTRSFLRLLSVDPGFRTAGAVVIDLTSPFAADAAAKARLADFHERVIARLSALPGVEAAGLVNAFPLGGGGFFADGQFIEMTRADEIPNFDEFRRLGTAAKDRIGYAGYRAASAGYFRTMGIPILRGRGFEDGDGRDAPHVGLISASLAKAKWPDQDPIGRFVQFGNMDGDLRGIRIVGVVADVRELSLEAQPGSLIYVEHRQRPATRVSVVLRSAAPATVSRAALEAVRQIDPEVPLQARTIEEAFDRTLAGRRFSLMVIALFGGAALTLATLGIYGLVSYLVAERTREIGVRLALGAERGEVMKMVLGKGVLLALGGIAAGLIAALALTRLVQGMLFGVDPTDPIALGGVTALTLLAVVAASYLPARRAMNLAPMTALRSE